MTDWERLTAELDLWQSEGRIATFWWRDDDLVAPTAALERLLHLREHFDLPISLAVIPSAVDPALLDYVEDCTILQHGYQHRNFAAEGSKKSEFPDIRNPDDIAEELTAGKESLTRLFTNQFVPVLVPPWNRIDERHVASLSGLGYIGLSRYKARNEPLAAPALAEINTHIDPVDWRGNRSVVATPALMDMICGHLAARRRGAADPQEPTGLLTHHLVHDEEIWAMLYKLLALLTDHPAVRWLPIEGAIALVDDMPEDIFFRGSDEAEE
ncbi:MAG: polysaccharide deacetylase family protein [Sneathiella sp.]